jgi:excisionase family DNA binding protein
MTEAPAPAAGGHDGARHRAQLPEPAEPLLVTVEEAARRLSIGRTATYMLVLKGELQSVKIGRTRRVLVASLIDYIQRLLERD